MSDLIAEEIAARCAGSTAPVAVRLPPSVDLLVALLGILKAGCWYMPIGLGEPEPRVAAMVEDGRPLAVVTNSRAVPAQLSPLPAIAVPATAPRTGTAFPVPATPPDQPVYLLFTSGSTGIPKGALIGSAAMCNRLAWMARHYRVTAADRILQKTPVTFDVAGWELFLPLITGARCVLSPEGGRRDPVQTAKLVRTHGITMCHFVPSMLEEFLRAADPDHCRSLRSVFASGEPLPPGLAHRFGQSFGATLHNLYGPTEAAIDVTHWTVPDTFVPTEDVPIGLPIDNVSLHVLDDACRPTPDGEPGELWIGGVAVGLGYVGRASRADAFRVAADGRRLYRTGDRVVLRNGLLHYLGRADDQVKVRGVRIEPGEVERALRQHPAVGQAVVLPVTTPGRGVELVAGLTVASPARPTDTELRGFLAGKLPAEYVPSGFQWIDRVPLLPTGKTDRRALRTEVTRWWHGVVEQAAEDERSGDPLARLWWSTLGPAGDRNETTGFLSLGGHSLLAIRLTGRLRDKLGVDVPLAALLGDDASLAELRRLVAAAPPAAAPGDQPPDAQVDGRSRSELAPAQQRLWLLSRSRPDADAYHVVGALRLRGRLVIGALRLAIGDVIARHDALRAEVVESPHGDPSLQYVPAAQAPLRIERTSQLETQTVEQFVRDLAAGDIPMTRAPMLRFGLLVAQGGGDAVLGVAIHHIIADQHSLELLLADLASAYEARLRDSAPRWPPAPSHAAYAAAESAASGGAAWQADLDFWRARLGGAPVQLTLPFRLRGKQPPGLRGAAHLRRLGPDRAREIDAVARAHAVTPVTLFSACVAVVLARWCGHDTVVLGGPASRRRTVAEHGLVGFLLDTMPIRLDVAAQSTFTALLRHARERLVEVLTHSRPTFDRIVAALGLPPVLDGNPLFDVWINDLTRAAAPPPFPGLDVAPVRLPGQAALFALNLYLYRDGDGYQMELVRAVDRVPAEVAEELLDQYVLVLDQALARPAVPLRELSVNTGRPGRRPRHRAVARQRGNKVLERVRASVAAHPEATALHTRSGAVTYRELGERLERLAGQLRAQGVRPADVVQIAARRGAALPVALLGTWAAGAVAGIVDAALPAARLGEYTAMLKPGWRLDLPTTDERDAVPVIGPGVADPCRLPDAGHVLFTSGTGGHPAGVRIAADALDHALSWYADTFQPTPADRTALLAGPGHDPVLRDMLVPLSCGGSVVIPGSDIMSTPSRLLGLLAEHEVTILHATPALLELLLAGAEHAAAPGLPRLRLVVSGGAALTAGLLRRLRTLTGAPVVNAYGTTETPQIVACQRVAVDDPALSGLADATALPVGDGMAGAEILVTRAGGRPCGVGELGEVVVRGPALALGYLAGTAARQDGFLPADHNGMRGFRTGDLGRFGPWGGVWLDGRLDRTVSVDGFRVALEEVETAALRHPDLVRAAANLVSTPLGALLQLRVVPAPGRAVHPDAVRTHLRGLLPAYAVPPVVRVVVGLSTDGNFKVTAEPAEHDEPPRHAAVAGGAGTLRVARELTGLLSQILGRPVAERENFFDAGLTSIGLLRLHSQLTRRFAVDIPVTALFTHVNPWALAVFLTGDDDRPADRRARRRPPDPGQLQRAARQRTALRQRMREERGLDG